MRIFKIVYGTHLPVLIKLVNMTDGPILEIGMGIYSTPYLHWACFEKKRKLVFYDNELKYFDSLQKYECDYHKIHFVENWDKIDISGHWSIALIDYRPSERRIEEIKRLANSVDYIVIHDTDEIWDKKYHYSEIYSLFKYRYNFTKIRPYTSVLSNFKNLLNL